MSGLDSIEIKVEGATESDLSALNAVPVLHEIRHALEQLASTGESSTIDLSSIPFGPGDREQLLSVLGHGEVRATVDAMGQTRVSETAYPGVWIVHYFSATEEELAVHVEVTRCPSLLLTPEQDVADSAAALALRLTEATASPAANRTGTPANTQE